MSAAAKPWKAQDSQDRRSNMVTSSVNAHAKKDGAGSYAWGSAMEVTDYEPVGLANSTKVITVMAAPAAAPIMVQQTMPPAVISDTQQFPTLGAQPAASPVTSVRWAAPAPAVYQAPPVQVAPPVTVAAPRYTTQAAKVVTMTGAATSVSIPPMGSQPTTVSTTVTTAGASPMAGAPRVILGEDMMRAGVTTLDATHPRNAFARKPHHKPFAGTVVATELQEAPAIDWTAAGTTSFQHQVIHQVAQNPAHLGPYIAEKPAIALSTLKAMPSPAAYVPNPRMSKVVASQPKTAKPQVMFRRGC